MAPRVTTIVIYLAGDRRFERERHVFLIRAAFWFSIVIMFIPADPETNTPAPRVTVIEALGAAQATVADLSKFCERNPDICVAGNAAFHVFADKAQSGARMLYRYLDDSFEGSSPDEEQGTLTGGDLLPEWRGPQGDVTA